MSNIESLLKLMKENQDLPVVPMVHQDVVADDNYHWWRGEWSHSEITEYYCGRDMIHFKDDDEEDVLSDLDSCIYGQDYYGRDIYELSDEQWKELYESVPWIKAIVVYITV